MPDPYEVLGIARDASLQEAKAAYRRLAMLFHPDRLAGLRPAVRAEGERRLRDATDALREVSSRFGRPLRAPGHAPHTVSADAAPTGATSGAVDIHVTQQPDAHLYDAELRALDGARLHVRWGGRHAAATLAVLQREHRIDDGPVRQIEWGAYEVVLVGADMRRLLDWVMPGGCAASRPRSWRPTVPPAGGCRPRRTCSSVTCSPPSTTTSPTPSSPTCSERSLIEGRRRGR